MFRKFESVTEKKKKFFGKLSLNTMGLTPGIYTPPSFDGLFISEWQISNFGQTITLPYDINGFYTGSINWGDENITTNEYRNRSHTYNTPGKYRIIVSGDVTGFKFNNSGSKDNILKIINWGKLKGINNSNDNMFHGCSNLKIDEVYDVIDLQEISSTSSMFRNCISMETINNLEEWNLSNVLDTSYMFYNASLFEGNTSNWDVSNVTNMDYMFYNAKIFNDDLSNWNVMSLTSAVGMLDFCDMSVLNYSNMLIGWSEIPNLQNNVILGANQNYYSDYSIYARNYLTGATKNWTILDDLRAPFIMVVRTTSSNESIVLPYVNSTGATYTGTIDWGDGTVVNNSYLNRTHYYSIAGNYNIKINGDVIGFSYGFGAYINQRPKIREIVQWGPLRGENNSNLNMFYSCLNLTANHVSDIFYTSGITNFKNAFFGCTSIAKINNSENWNLKSALDLSNMFKGATNFDQSLGSWNISGVTTMDSMLTNTNLSVSNYSNTLIGWSSLPVIQNNVLLGANNLKYNTSGLTARNLLSSSPYLWNITDSGIA